MNQTMFVSALIGVGLALLFIRLSAMERRLKGLSRLDAKVDALLKHSGVEFDAFQGVPPDVEEALARGETIVAIKRFRQATGAGLKEAKEFVDEVRRLRITLLVLVALLFSTPGAVLARQAAPRTLVAVLAHADDEDPVAPILARYAREGVQVHLLIATDGGEGTGFAAARGDAAPRDLVRVRTEEARCAAKALGVAPPILLSFPDGKLGDYAGDRGLVYRLTQRIAEELQRLQPDVIVTWGPDGGMGHPDHRIVSSIVMQLQRAGAPGVPERIFYMYLPAEAIRAVNPQRGEPPLLVPDERYAIARVPFRPDDLQAAARSMACHKSQFSEEVVQRVQEAARHVWDGAIPLVPAFPTGRTSDLFR